MFVRKESCPECGSKDNVAVWQDDDGVERKRCFTNGCDYSLGYGTRAAAPAEAVYSPCSVPPDAQHLAITGRGITLDTAIFYDVRYSPSTTSLIFPYKKMGVVVGYKGRNLSVPKNDPAHFYVKGKVSKLLFGAQAVKNKEQRNRRLLLCFGELDVLAAYQMLGIPAVCAQNDSATIETLKANLAAIEDMDTVYVVPDADPSCLPLVPLIAELLEVECKVVTLRRYKDPNDYLMAGQVQLFRDEFYSAEVVPRTYLVRGDQLLEKGIMELKSNKLGIFVGCTPIDLGVGGIRFGELSFVLGSPFAGKSTFTHTLAAQCLAVGMKVLYISVEEKTGKAIANIMRASASQPLHAHDSISEILDKVGDMSNLLTLEDSEEFTPETLERRLRQLVRAEGVQVVFIDNLTAIAGGTAEQWKTMNEYILATRRLTSTKEVACFWVAHTSRGSQADSMESGYGTSFVEKIADNLIGAMRSDEEENGVKLQVLKCRALGKVSTFRGVYDPKAVSYKWDSRVDDTPARGVLLEQLERMV